MRIGLFVNDIWTESAEYTTTRLALDAVKLGHEVWYIGAEDFAYDADRLTRARARSGSKTNYRSLEAYLEDVQGDKARSERITIADLDVLLLRSDPSLDATERPWAQNVGIIFGQVAAAQGVIVLNDPGGLSKAVNKLYFQHFPQEVQPRTLITRDREEIKQFVNENGGYVVLKPLQGSGGQSVFLVKENDQANLNQMIDAITRSGYVIVQEYLSAAAKGDTRLFLMNGKPLEYKGKYAAFQRVRTGEDIRSNMHAGGSAKKAKIDDTALRIAEIVRPRLIQDGMFLVGLDIAGDKLMEINVFSPGGFGSAEKFEDVKFTHAVLEALERKVDHKRQYGASLDNVQLAML